MIHSFKLSKWGSVSLAALLATTSPSWGTLAEWEAAAAAVSSNVTVSTNGGLGYTFDGTAGLAYDYGNLDSDSDPLTPGAGASIEFIFDLSGASDSTALGAFQNITGAQSVLKLEQASNTQQFGVTIPGYYDFLFPDSTSTFDKMTHVVFVNRADGQFELFVNGISQGIDDGGPDWVTNGGPGWLGAAAATQDVAAGTIYGVASYNAELSAAQVAALYAAYTPPFYYTDWIAGYPAVAAASGFDDDPDGDGLANGIEQALGSDPTAPNAGLTALSATPDSFVFQGTRTNAPALDVVASYEWSTDLVEWHPSRFQNEKGLMVILSQTRVVDEEAPLADTVQVEASLFWEIGSDAVAPRFFCRLRANQATTP